MADMSEASDDEYSSPREFNDDREKSFLHRKINELTKQVECLKENNDEAHRYISEISPMISSYGELEKELKRQQILNKYLENRLEVDDEAYVKLWKEVSPSKDNTITTDMPQEEDGNKASSTLLDDGTASKSKGNLSDQHNHDVFATGTKEIDIQALDANEAKTFLRMELKINDKLKRRLATVREEKQALSDNTSREITKRDNIICRVEQNLRLVTEQKGQLEQNLDIANARLAEKGLTNPTTSENVEQEVNALLIKLGKTEENMRMMAAQKGQLEKDFERAKYEWDSMEKKMNEDKEELKSKVDRMTLALHEKVESLQQQIDVCIRDRERKNAECNQKQIALEELKKQLEEKEQIQVTRDEENQAMVLKIEKLENLRKEQYLVKVENDDELCVSELKNEAHEKEEENIQDTSDEELQALQLENNVLKSALQTLLHDEKQEQTGTYNLIETHPSLAPLTAQPAKQKKTIVVGIRSVRSGMGKTMTDNVIQGLQQLLRDRMIRERIDIYTRPCQTLEDITDGPLFVLCLAKTIIGTKVKALEGIPVNKNTVLIIIHMTDNEESLSLATIGVRSYASELHQLGGTMDMVFNSGSRFSDCDDNTTAVERMAIFFKKL